MCAAAHLTLDSLVCATTAVSPLLLHTGWLLAWAKEPQNHNRRLAGCGRSSEPGSLDFFLSSP